MQEHSEPVVRRRRVLGAALAAGASAGLSGCLDLAEGGDDAETPDGKDVPDRLIPEGPTVRLERVAAGLTAPTDLASPGGEALYVTDQSGIVFRIEDGRPEPFLDLQDRVIDVSGEFSERGLLGLAFHPEFADNGRMFVRYSRYGRSLPEGMSHVEQLSEFVVTDGVADPESETHVLTLEQPFIVHNSGNVLFGPDGYLYVTTGDGGGPYEERPSDWYEENVGGRGQNTTADLLGGVLRIDVDGGDPYAVPPDNPLVGTEGHRDEYYAWGLRNPWGSSFDGEDLYVADVGQVSYESVNLVEKGGNYGWNVKEGTHCYDTEDGRNPPAECPDATPETVRGGEPLRDPIVEYPHEYDGTRYGSAVVGGYVYRGDEVPALDGTYVFADWSKRPHEATDGALYAATPPGADDEPRHPYNEQRDLWQLRELAVEGPGDVGEEGNLNRYVSSLGRVGDDIYVLTTDTTAVEGETAAVYRIAAPDP